MASHLINLMHPDQYELLLHGRLTTRATDRVVSRGKIYLSTVIQLPETCTPDIAGRNAASSCSVWDHEAVFLLSCHCTLPGSRGPVLTPATLCQSSSHLPATGESYESPFVKRYKKGLQMADSQVIRVMAAGI